MPDQGQRVHQTVEAVLGLGGRLAGPRKLLGDAPAQLLEQRDRFPQGLVERFERIGRALVPSPNAGPKRAFICLSGLADHRAEFITVGDREFLGEGVD